MLAFLLAASLCVAGCGPGGRPDMNDEQRDLSQLIQDGERLIDAELDLRANLPTIHDDLGSALTMVLRNVLFGANNIYDILMLYNDADSFKNGRLPEVVQHMHDRMGIVLASNQEDLRLLRESKDSVFDPNVLLHINYLIEYTRRINAIIAKAMLKTGASLESR